MEITEDFYHRLANWRRVYGDRPSYWRSPTLIFCRYAQAYFDRAPETEQERHWREVRELSYREPSLPPPDYKDAEFLNSTWANMPEFIEGVPVKKNIRVFVFGTNREYERLKRKTGIGRIEEKQWREKFLKLFFDVVEKKSK